MSHKLINDDLFNALPKMEENSIDTVIIDPPYGISFMNKNWDSFEKGSLKSFNDDHSFKNNKREKSKSAYTNRSTAAGSYDFSAKGNRAFQTWCQKWASELLRVTKPGGTLLAFGSTRTWHRLTCGLEDAGWEVRDTMIWLNFSGFPKSHNIGFAIRKDVEKQMREQGVVGEIQWK